MTETKEVLKGQIDQLIGEMRLIEVKTDDEYKFLEAWLKRNKESQKIVAEAFEAERVAAKAAYDDILAAKGAYLEPLLASEKVARGKMSTYATAKEQARREAQRRLDDLARQEAETKRLAEAQALSDAGKFEKADALIDKAIRPAAAKVEPSLGKMREVWSAEVVDMPAFLQAVARGEIASSFISINQSALNSAAQAQKAAFRMAGVAATQRFVAVL